MLYAAHATQRLMMEPINVLAEAGQVMLAPFADTSLTARTTRASLEMLSRVTRSYEKPAFDLDVQESVLVERPFGRLLHFKCRHDVARPRNWFVVAPLSGHHATLLRHTVDTLLDTGDVTITDWTCASRVPIQRGTFSLDDYVAYLIEFMQLLAMRTPGRRFHAVAVCQPGPALVMAATIQTLAGGARPAAMTLISAPMDPAAGPTEVTRLAESHSEDWFRKNVIHAVPFGRPGAGRRVYPGFLQMMGFMSMDPDRHIEKHYNLFMDRIVGNHDAADRVAEFYDEYWSVLDLDEEIYIDSIVRVFQQRELATGRATWRGQPLDTGAITDIPLQTIEGGRDDICAPGQTEAAHEILAGIPQADRDHHVEPEVGHYGGFAGRRFRQNVFPQIDAFAEAYTT